jgi:predicted glycosyltransferase
MTTEKTIQICGKEVAMRYCAATETGYEKISGKSSAIFVPEIEKDEDGNIKSVKQNAKTEDFIILAVAAIIAAYQRKKEDAPITADYIIYEANPEEVKELLKTICELRNEWYNIPAVVNTDENMTDDEKEAAEKEEKN